MIIEDKESDFIHGAYHVLKHEIENGEWKQRANSEALHSTSLIATTLRANVLREK